MNHGDIIVEPGDKLTFVRFISTPVKYRSEQVFRDGHQETGIVIKITTQDSEVAIQVRLAADEEILIIDGFTAKIVGWKRTRIEDGE